MQIHAPSGCGSEPHDDVMRDMQSLLDMMSWMGAARRWTADQVWGLQEERREKKRARRRVGKVDAD